jgi:hypothetical protein
MISVSGQQRNRNKRNSLPQTSATNTGRNPPLEKKKEPAIYKISSDGLLYRLFLEIPPASH